jgi:hypothetical protein
MKSIATVCAGILALLTPTLALPQPLPLDLRRADATKVGYLDFYWKTEDESVYLALSNNSNPLDFTPINGGKPVVSPTLGTKAVRDVSIVEGVGRDKGKYWLIGTDLDIDTVCPLTCKRQEILTVIDQLGQSDSDRITGHLRLGEQGSDPLD